MNRVKLLVFLIYLLSFSQAQSQIIRDEWVNCGNGNCQILVSNYISGAKYVWEGQCKNNKANGYGTLKEYFNNSLYSTYSGYLTSGEKSGIGTIKFFNGTKLNCTFLKNQANGSGKIEFENGNIYEGDIINGVAHGNCHTQFGNGGQFDGFYLNGRVYNGIYIDPSGKKYYYQLMQLS